VVGKILGRLGLLYPVGSRSSRSVRRASRCARARTCRRFTRGGRAGRSRLEQHRDALLHQPLQLLLDGRLQPAAARDRPRRRAGRLAARRRGRGAGLCPHGHRDPRRLAGRPLSRHHTLRVTRAHARRHRVAGCILVVLRAGARAADPGLRVHPRHREWAHRAAARRPRARGLRAPEHLRVLRDDRRPRRARPRRAAPRPLGLEPLAAHHLVAPAPDPRRGVEHPAALPRRLEGADEARVADIGRGPRGWDVGHAVDDVRGGHRPRPGVVRGQPVPPAASGDARVRTGPGWRLASAHARAAHGPRRAAARGAARRRPGAHARPRLRHRGARGGCCRSA